MARRRPTTNHELARMRACAAYGLSIANTARVMGCSEHTVRYWSVREDIRFARHTRLPTRELPVAIDNIRQLMASLA
jgi:hypothetical protein